MVVKKRKLNSIMSNLVDILFTFESKPEIFSKSKKKKNVINQEVVMIYV